MVGKVAFLVPLLFLLVLGCSRSRNLQVQPAPDAPDAPGDEPKVAGGNAPPPTIEKTECLTGNGKCPEASRVKVSLTELNQVGSQNCHDGDPYETPLNHECAINSAEYCLSKGFVTGMIRTIDGADAVIDCFRNHVVTPEYSRGYRNMDHLTDNGVFDPSKMSTEEIQRAMNRRCTANDPNLPVGTVTKLGNLTDGREAVFYTCRTY